MDDFRSKAPDSGSAAMTRREWLLKLGEAAILLGWSGQELEAPSYAAAIAATSAEAAQLPPGLYEPSIDHLSHVLTLDSPFRPVPSGSEVDYVGPRSGVFEPQFFAPDEFRLA